MTQGVWRVKFDGHCSRCGIPLSAGSPAVYDRANRTIHCIECPSASSDPAPSPLAGTEDHAPSPGTAGASARREHERRKGAREARVTERFGPRVGKVLLAIAGEESTTAVWRTGAIGEETVGLVLADVPDVRVLHDRAIPGTRANIDHIVVGPAGVFVVDAKRYRGRIEVRDRGSLFRRDLRLVIGGRDRSAIRGVDRPPAGSRQSGARRGRFRTDACCHADPVLRRGRLADHRATSDLPGGRARRSASRSSSGSGRPWCSTSARSMQSPTPWPPRFRPDDASVARSPARNVLESICTSDAYAADMHRGG